ncbi:transglycosylase domain-containing protein [Oceanobacillus chungangensis]|uniref:Monofunctional biosynthetic peptidoglycan transglycosylase n=1 Tax=Oceanobacillus chungangensis TaxID=1229152 RepID=A0A3D8PWP0_9BACI|nr:transglycosylase domain-containing protein [Oceanobacillus chungangensis]RDW20513.1 monofunctional biosynthetic peptidoglycan transglycosylase [Oceanobacillus chungangensis]
MKRQLPFKNRKWIILKLFIGMFISACLFLIGIYFISFLMGPPALTSEENTIYYSNNGEVIGEDSGLENRYWLDLDEIPPAIVDATILIEDQHFFEHNGFDLKRIAGAILKNIQSLSLKEGASTLTQQYARNVFLSHEKTWTRKLKEAFYTIRLEMYYSKEEILEGYLNTVYYGHGTYGVEAASKYFFDKSAEELDLAEAAMLAGVPKGPTYYSPFNNAENAINRQAIILQLMLNNNAITMQEYEHAKKEVLAYSQTRKIDKKKKIGPYFQDLALKEAAKLLDLEMKAVRTGGFNIYTTLDVDEQSKLETTTSATISGQSNIEIGAMAMDPESGAIRALIGGRDYQKSPFNRAVDALRMPGSTFKPFLYYAALNNGYTASTLLESKPTTFTLEDGEVYSPSNYNDYYAEEPITLAQALSLSDNIYAVKTNLYLGTDNLVKTARQFGITSDLPAVPSLALGTATVSLKEMVTAYGMLANGGKQIDGHTIEKITDRNGNIIFERDNDPGRQVLEPKQAFILTNLMTGMFDHNLDGYTTVTGASIADSLTRPYAGKSGTTKSDNWMIGYSPSLVTGIWTGYDDNRAMEIVAENAYAKQIWANFMEDAHKELPQENFTVPVGVVGIPIDPTTGALATPYCDTSVIMYFEMGTEPRRYCMEHFHKEDKVGPNQNKGIVERWFDLLF